MARDLGAELRTGVLDRRRVMRYALGTVAGAIAVPVLSACGGSPTANSSTSSSAASSSSSATPLPAPLPANYQATWPLNVGKSQVQVPGSMYVTQNGSLEMASFGNDIWNSADNCAFYGEQTSGDGTWSVEVAIQANTNEWAKAGIMLRQSLDPTDAMLIYAVSPQHGVFVDWRGVKAKPAQGGPTNDAVAAAPIYLKLQKKGNIITIWDSTDGQTWQNQAVMTGVAMDPNTGKPPVASSSTSGSSASAAAAAAAPANPIPIFKDPYYVGLACCSHDAKLRGRVGFDQITGFKSPKYTSIFQSTAKNNW